MSSYRQTQPKAQTEANAKTLRALVKQPDNKVCADCKRNDPRWASWNIGCFLCIRCSGIHRSMGTHISKVKSIDLDIWTAEQMDSIQKWGNKRCNLYWEAHLKAGHVPPDHKIESFIRSKYETRRWAKDGPPPSDPAVLEGNAPSASANPASATNSSASTSRPAKQAPSAIDLLGGEAPVGPPTTGVSGGASLLDDFSAPPSKGTGTATVTAPPSAAASTPAAAAAPSAPTQTSSGGGLFDLDWKEGPASPAVTSPSSNRASKGSKNDILSLYATSAKPTPATSAFSSPSAGGLDAFSSLSLSNTSAQPSGNIHSPPSSGTAKPWSAGVAASTSPRKSSNPWSSQDAWASSTTDNDVWGNMTSANASTNPTSAKNDAFADIWSDFK